MTLLQNEKDTESLASD